jgi:hypothetical protein
MHASAASLLHLLLPLLHLLVLLHEHLRRALQIGNLVCLISNLVRLISKLDRHLLGNLIARLLLQSSHI